MAVLISVLLVLAAAGTQAACVRANVNEASQPLFKASPCQTWEQMVSKLSASQKATLLKEGIVSGYGGFILSETLVADCDLRLRLGVYLRQVMGGRDDRDKEFATRHSKEIVEVLRRIWPSLSGAQNWAADGGGHEKYLLLSDPQLEESTIAPLIGDILQKEGINIDLVAVIFRRPLPALRPALSDQVSLAEKNHDIPTQIYGLALLQRLDDLTASAKLKTLFEQKELTDLERKLILALLAKIDRHEEITLADVEELEYRNNRR